MTISTNNPFHELFVTDSASPEDFVRYFSPYLVPHTLELFREGNVVLKGTQGCGKSMLLKLLQPEIRVAYSKSQTRTGKEIQFPVPVELRSFVGAGANLSKSGLMDLVQMLPVAPTTSDYQRLTSLFADFLNYWLLRDLLTSLTFISDNDSVFEGLVTAERFDAFAGAVAREDCWFDYLGGVRTFSDLLARVNERVLGYRRWLARNTKSLDPQIEESKTAIGEALSRTVDCLKATGVLAKNTPVFFRIDQMEELWHRTGNPAILSTHLRQVLNRAIGNRDLRISFRLGTRRYSWEHQLSLPGGRNLEEHRDYLTVDIDKTLRRNEDRSGWLFEGFAADVFAHRVEGALQGGRGKRGVDRLKNYFGTSPSWQEVVNQLIVAAPEDPKKLLRLDDRWSKPWLKLIGDVYNGKYSKGDETRRDPFLALLLVAWGLQTGGIQHPTQRRESPPPDHFPPWTVWWHKERAALAAIQLVVRHQQTMFWWGSKRILSLSSSNVTLFLSICREIWDQWIRRTMRSKKPTAEDPQSLPIDWKIQAVAIDNVSKTWHRNFSMQPGRPAGDVRMRFVDALGNWLRRQMLDDSAMTYPGGNGFSLRKSDLERAPDLALLLEEAVGWGDLYEVEHTTKISAEKHKDPRRKYYLNPVLSPHFQIPDAHTKEPLYSKFEEVLGLARRAHALPSNVITSENVAQRVLDL